MTDKLHSVEHSRATSTDGRFMRLAWLPVPLLLAAILACRLAGLSEDYPHDNLRLALSVIFYTAVSLTTLILIGRSFLKSGKPGLLLLECGVVLWSLSGTVGDAVSHGDQNVNATIFNLTILLAGMCHLGGAALSLGLQRELRARYLWLVAGFGVALGALATIVWAALAGWTPVFFIQNKGGTSERTAVLISAITMFLLSAILLRVGRRGAVTRFVQWYCFALLLLAVGLFGIMIQTSIGCIVNWLARSAQWLGGAYLLVAALVSVRETGRWDVSLDPEAWDDRVLRLMTPYLLSTLPTAWRYGLAILVVVAATSLRWALLPWMGTTVPYNAAMVAIIVVAIFLGTGPALLTLVLGDIAVEVFVMGATRTAHTGESYSRLAVSMAIGFLVCWVFHAMRAAARKIQKSEARLSAFAEATFEGICESEGGLIMDCNEQFARMAVATRSELIGTPISEMVVPEDSERVSANIRENREVVIEHGMLRRHGTPITVEAHGRPVVPGSSRRYTAVRDITERKRAEEEIRESEERYRTLFESIDQGFCTIEVLFDENDRAVDYRFLTVNPAFERQTGIQNGVGRRMREIAPLHEEHWFQIYGSIALTGESMRFENSAAQLNRFYEVFAWRVGAPKERKVAILFNDISARKRAAIELQEANAGLEKRVEERTSELTQRAAQLRALAGELTLSEQRERSRLAKILHDHLQQLLVAAKFRTAMLGRGGDELMRQATKEVEDLIDESIAASRNLTAELSPPILQEAGLNAGLQWLARRMTDKQGLFVDLEMAEDGAIPQDIKVLLFESVRELLFNVVKHAHTRSATVSVRRINDHLQVIVSDQGIGFDPNALPAVGEGGRGFGLFSIRERIELMGGTVAIESNLGQGSRFILSLPVAPSTKSQQAQESIAPPEAQATPPGFPDSGRMIRVMLVDDHAVVRQGMANLLGDEPDMEVVGEAADGQEAVEVAARLLPDVILMDLSMPKLNGVEATRIIHNDWPGIRIIGLSMFEEADRAQAMQDAGAVNYVTKSGPARELINAIRTSIRTNKVFVVKAAN